MSFDGGINDLWRDEACRGSFAPRYYGAIQPCDFLLVGLNPSLPKRQPKFIEPLLEKRGLGYPNCFEWDNSGLANGFDRELAAWFVQVDRLAIQEYSFFDRPKQVGQRFEKEDLKHVDLFFYRCPSFRQLPACYHSRRNHKFSDNPNFVQKQLDISLRIIQAHQPKIILFVYAGVADIFLRHLKSRPGPPIQVESQPVDKTPVSHFRINLTPVHQTLCIRWPALPKGCRGSMSDEEFAKVLQILHTEITAVGVAQTQGVRQNSYVRLPGGGNRCGPPWH